MLIETPELSTILYKQSIEDSDWIGYGFDAIDFQAFPNLESRREELTKLFNVRYYNRKINADTLHAWQMRLQSHVNDVGFYYDNMYGLYDKHRDELTELYDRKSTYTTEQESVGTSKTSASSGTRKINTPNSALNSDPDYADEVTDVSADGAQSNLSELNTTGINVTLRDPLTKINEIGQGLKDLDTSFIASFENLFSNVFEVI